MLECGGSCGVGQVAEDVGGNLLEPPVLAQPQQVHVEVSGGSDAVLRGPDALRSAGEDTRCVA